jgi:hypothetical protein
MKERPAAANSTAAAMRILVTVYSSSFVVADAVELISTASMVGTDIGRELKRG